jgi:hypothetical protein
VLDPENVPPITSNEDVARFILSASHIRSSDGTVKPDAFIPHPRPELSLTRLRDATEQEIWQEGRRVANLRLKTLLGRADVRVAAFTEASLTVVAKPLAENPNHADAVGWPDDKPSQKMKAILVSRQSRFTATPAL